jgi:hypothetical protein
MLKRAGMDAVECRNPASTKFCTEEPEPPATTATTTSEEAAPTTTTSEEATTTTEAATTTTAPPVKTWHVTFLSYQSFPGGTWHGMD